MPASQTEGLCTPSLPWGRDSEAGSSPGSAHSGCPPCASPSAGVGPADKPDGVPALEDMFQTGSHRGEEVVTVQNSLCQCHPRPWDPQGPLTIFLGKGLLPRRQVTPDPGDPVQPEEAGHSHLQHGGRTCHTVSYAGT